MRVAPCTSRSRSITRGPQRTTGAARPSRGFECLQLSRSSRGCIELRQQAGDGIDEVRLLNRSHRSRAVQARTRSTSRVCGRRCERLEGTLDLAPGCSRLLPRATYAGTQCGSAAACRPRASFTTSEPALGWRRRRGRRRRAAFRCRQRADADAGRVRAPFDFATRSSGDMLLQSRPPVRQFRIDFAGLGAQQQEIVGSAKSRMLEQAQCAAARATLEARLQHDQFAHRHRKALRQRDATHLATDHLVARREQVLRILRQRARPSRPQRAGSPATAARRTGRSASPSDRRARGRRCLRGRVARGAQPAESGAASSAARRPASGAAAARGVSAIRTNSPRGLRAASSAFRRTAAPTASQSSM